MCQQIGPRTIASSQMPLVVGVAVHAGRIRGHKAHGMVLGEYSGKRTSNNLACRGNVRPLLTGKSSSSPVRQYISDKYYCGQY